MSCGRFERAGAARVCSRARRILLAQALIMASELRKWRRGRVAQLARARRLQRRGHRFEPCHAHHTPSEQRILYCSGAL
jgi:hypothetical protein